MPISFAVSIGEVRTDDLPRVPKDFVLDTETTKLAYAEEANNFKPVHPQGEGRES